MFLQGVSLQSGYKRLSLPNPGKKKALDPEDIEQKELTSGDK